VVRHWLRLTGVGIAAGLCAALALTRVMNNMFVGVSAMDAAIAAGKAESKLIITPQAR
jgi:hypothetical protein